MIMSVCSLLALLLFFQQYQEGIRETTQGILRSDREGEVREETFVARREDGTKVEVPVQVSPRQLSTEEKQKILEQAKQEFVKTYLGENVSEENVTEDLNFASHYMNGQVTAVCESSQPQYLWEDGTIHTDHLPEAMDPVKITVNFTCQDMHMEYVCYVTLKKKASDMETGKTTGIQKAVEDQEASSREQSAFVLPDTVDGQKITWKKRLDLRPLFLPVVGILLIVCIQQKPVQDRKKEQKLREKELLREYPVMVMQMSLLMGAGMTAVTAWERIAGRYDQKKDGQKRRGKDSERSPRYLEEMRITSREIRDGGNVRRAWETFGNRVALAPYRKFTALLLQNMDKGTRDTAFLLGQEAELVIEEQKNCARRLGEEAGTKLLFPMLMMLMVILIIIMVPAMMSF